MPAAFGDAEDMYVAFSALIVGSSMLALGMMTFRQRKRTQLPDWC